MRAQSVTGLRRPPSLYNWIRTYPGAQVAQGNPTCGHCRKAGLWQEGRFVTPGGKHETAMRCSDCGKLSYFKTPAELQYGERRLASSDERPARPKRRR